MLKERLQKAAIEMDSLRQSLGPEKFAQVEDLANRFYELNQKALNLAHIHGLITDEDYKKCLARGNEYAPVCWIIHDALTGAHQPGPAVESDKPFPEIKDEDIPF